ncbi:VOC family protein [Paucibacter sp. B2R-40]|uniref:VOC family protein n=1 Tax=Paucibacter sp. B2R-40 TaxID=2893554 RepID=UPI0021E3A4B0|nr:VOC family protein [Paucibacter sp. B2R-40]MCV2354610.1 VOC family protein [Paucibacter sp. B2R-40]
MKNSIVWVDIPVRDLDRAIGFYSAVLGRPASKEGGPGFVFGLLAHEGDEVGGCLYLPDADNAPSKAGPLVYLNVEGRMAAALEAVSSHGGQVVKPSQAIGPHGFRAIVDDSEGNRLALHAQTAAQD